MTKPSKSRPQGTSHFFALLSLKLKLLARMASLGNIYLYQSSNLLNAFRLITLMSCNVIVLTQAPQLRRQCKRCTMWCRLVMLDTLGVLAVRHRHITTLIKCQNELLPLLSTGNDADLGKSQQNNLFRFASTAVLCDLSGGGKRNLANVRGNGYRHHYMVPFSPRLFEPAIHGRIHQDNDG